MQKKIRKMKKRQCDRETKKGQPKEKNKIY